MFYDWYSTFEGNSLDEIKEIDIDCYSKIKLIHSRDSSDKEKGYHKELICEKEKEYPKFIENSFEQLSTLLKTPQINLKLYPQLDLKLYPLFTFFLQFKFTLATHFISLMMRSFISVKIQLKKIRFLKYL
jgi:hypothetical protein